MPLVVTSADVEFYAALTRRLGQAAEAVSAASTQCGSLLDGARWSGRGAVSGEAAERRLAEALAALGRRLGELAGRVSRRRDDLVAELARRRALEASVLDDLGRLARAPGDLENDTRAELARIRGSLPVTGHQLWEHLHHAVGNLLP